MIDSDTDLQSGKKSMEFSMGPYFKTRPAASKQAVKRAREFIDDKCGGQQRLLGAPLTCLFGSAILGPSSFAISTVDESSRESILNQLRSFRPSQAAHSASACLGAIVKTDTRKALEDKLYGAKRARDLASDILDEQRREAGWIDDGDDDEDACAC